MSSELPPYAQALPPARCTQCAYVIEHLGQQGTCPECGLRFDLADPLTYTRKPPFIWWRYWLPALAMSIISGAALYIILVVLVGYTWASVVCVPLTMGVLMGYNAKVHYWFSVLLLIGAIGGVAVLLGMTGLAGVFCALVVFGIALIPGLIGLGVGILLGSALRSSLKRSTFSQRWHLLLILGFPLLVGLIEGRHVHIPPVTLTTTLSIHTPIQQAWDSIQFYEQVKHRPPWLLRLTPEFRPMYTTGSSEKVGDVKVCVYERGRLVKQITDVVPGKRLAFKVIEQTDVETRGVRLIDGSFDLTPSADGKETSVTLTTRYEPLLEPRVAFLWSEKWAVHTLHGHVLKGMQLDAEARQ